MTGYELIDDYITYLRSNPKAANKDMLAACSLIERKLDAPDAYCDETKAETAIKLIEKYFAMPLFPWEKFVIALVHCYYSSDDTVVFSELLIMMGRGNGKNGFISGLVWYLTTKAHGVAGYNVDIVANSEDQAKTSFGDVYQMLEDTWLTSKRYFKKTLEIITSLTTRSYIKYNTSNAKTKDGKRSACLVFDEIHEYQNDDSIKVFRSGFGKRKHSRVFYITTQGYVRDGVLDQRLGIAERVLNGEIPNSRLLPLLYRLDNRAEAEDEANWEKANPSLPYLPTLRIEIEQRWHEKDYDPSIASDLYTKRFNLPEANLEIAVTKYENLTATKEPLPNMEGWACTAGIDYAELNDWAAVNLHFRKGEKRYDISHAFVCLQSRDLNRIKAPWRDWERDGYITAVDDVSIHPDLIAEYIQRMGQRYSIKMLAMDNFRWALLAESLNKIGWDAKDKERVKLIRPSDIMRVEPIVQECFNRQLFTWGDVPMLRWAVNNTKRIRSSRNIGADTGNYIYAKIEGKSRKTDPFMALVASMCVEDAIGTTPFYEFPPMGAIKL